MPRLNLKDEEPPSSPNDSDGGTPPVPDGFGEEPSRKTPWLIFGALVLVAAVAVVFLNQKNIIHLWGHRAPRVVEALPEPAPLTPNDSAAMAVSPSGPSTPPPATKTPEKAAKTTPEKSAPVVREQPALSSVSSQHSGSTAGGYAVQISSWPGKNRADAIATELNDKGFRAYVFDGVVNGTTWYRVRVGNYATSKEAAGAIGSLEEKGYAGGIVVKAGK